jgi:hypothetical protein
VYGLGQIRTEVILAYAYFNTEGGVMRIKPCNTGTTASIQHVVPHELQPIHLRYLS